MKYAKDTANLHSGTRWATLLIVSAMLASSVLIGCAENTAQEEKDTDTGTAASVQSEAVTEVLPTPFEQLEKKDYQGKEFVILQRHAWGACEDYTYEFTAEEETGDLVNDAIFERNRKTEELLNYHLRTESYDWDWGGGDKFFRHVSDVITAGDPAYDMISGMASMALSAVKPGYYHNWYDLEGIDYADPWWSKLIADSLTINDRMFAMSGDLTLSLWKSMEVLYFNKKMAGQYDLPDLYEEVRNGTWTIDKLITYAENAVEDLDGNGKFTLDDRFGYISNFTNMIDGYQSAFNIRVIDKNEQGYPELVVNTPHTVDGIEKMLGLIYNTNNCALNPKIVPQWPDNRYDILDVMFSEDRALFYAYRLMQSEKLRGMESDYGMLPLPKFDENQDQYYCTTQDNFSLCMLPTTSTDLVFLSDVIEAMCRASYTDVIPTYMDVVIKYKGVRDTESEEMLEIIRNSLIYDFGYLNSFGLEGAGHLFVGLVRGNSSNFASEYNKKEKSIHKKLEKMLEAYYD